MRKEFNWWWQSHRFALGFIAGNTFMALGVLLALVVAV